MDPPLPIHISVDTLYVFPDEPRSNSDQQGSEYQTSSCWSFVKRHQLFASSAGTAARPRSIVDVIQNLCVAPQLLRASQAEPPVRASPPTCVSKARLA